MHAGTGRRLLVLPLACALITLCAAADAEAQSSLTARVALRGVLVDAATGEAIEGGVVSIPAQARGALSRADGTFELAGVPEGVQILRVQRIGYAEATRVIDVVADLAPLRITLDASPVSVEGVDITVDGRANVSGVVIDGGTGAPMADVLVWLPREEAASATDSLGRFTFPDVELGPSLLQVERAGYGRLYRPISVAPDAASLHVVLEPDSVVLRSLPVVERELRVRRNRVPTVVVAMDHQRLSLLPAADARLAVQNFTHTRVVACQGAARSHWCVDVGGRAVEPNVCLDGVPAWGGLDALQQLRPHDLYLLEVYGIDGRTVRAYTHEYMENLARDQTGPVPDEPAAQREGVEGLGWSNGRAETSELWTGARC